MKISSLQELVPVEQVFPVILPTGVAVTGDDEQPVTITLVCQDDIRFTDAIDKTKKDPKDTDVVKMAKLISASILDWSHPDLFGGECNEDNKVKFLSDQSLQWLTMDIYRYTKERKHFFRK